MRLLRLIVSVLFCLALISVSMLSVVADDNIVSYTLSSEQMLAMLNAGRCGYSGGMPGSGYEFHGTLDFSSFDTGSDGVYAIVHNTQGGPGCDISLTFDFPLDIKCLSFTVSSAFGTKITDEYNNVSYLVPTDGWLGSLPGSGLIDSEQNHIPGQINTNTILNFKVLITNATFHYSDMTNVTGFQNYFKTSWGYSSSYQFLYCINAITYTGRKADIDDLVNAIDNLIQNNNDNTDRIIANQDKNTSEIKDKIYESARETGEYIGQHIDDNTDRVIDNDNANHQEDMQQREDQHQEDMQQRDQIWNDTYNPSDEEVGDLSGAIFDDGVQDELTEKLGLFTFIDDTLQDLLSAFDDEGTAGTALVMPALVVPVNGVDYTVIEETTFDMADTLDEIPTLVAAIRFVTGVVIIFGFLGYLHRLKVRFFGAD